MNSYISEILSEVKREDKELRVKSSRTTVEVIVIGNLNLYRNSRRSLS